MEQIETYHQFQKPDLNNNVNMNGIVNNQPQMVQSKEDVYSSPNYSPRSPQNNGSYSSGEEKSYKRNGNIKQEIMIDKQQPQLIQLIPQQQPIPIQQQNILSNNTPNNNNNNMYKIQQQQPIQQQHFSPTILPMSMDQQQQINSSSSSSSSLKKEHRSRDGSRSNDRESSSRRDRESSSSSSSSKSKDKLGSPNSNSPLLPSNGNINNSSNISIISSTSSGIPVQVQHQLESLQLQVDNLKNQNQSLYDKIRDYENQIEKKSLLLGKYRKTLLQFFEEDRTDDNLSDRSRSRSRSRSPSYSRSRSGSRSSSRSRSGSPSSKHVQFNQIQYLQHQQQHQQLQLQQHQPSGEKNDHKRKIEDISSKHISINNISGGGSNVMMSQTTAPGIISGADQKDTQKRRRVGSRKHNLWTADDDEKFTAAYNQYGKSWKNIHSHLPDKTREQVQSHGQYLIRIGKLVDLHKDGRRTRHQKDDKDNNNNNTLNSNNNNNNNSNNSNILLLPQQPHNNNNNNNGNQSMMMIDDDDNYDSSPSSPLSPLNE